ncbi:hypothetical protein INT48_005323 [Thamnidium elegans]|uniref:Uncharacterized protein n=1 Tax=Thamnidium elegans TaxID=101142 RepID=A0A8H7SI67_9FUNG|nr:hypothetical protein INT48_005323 [Thamnidium elegans]
MDQYSQDLSIIQDFNMGSSGSLPSFSIPNTSTQASSFNSYQTPYNSSEYVHVSRIEEILIKSVESIVDRVVEKHTNRLLAATSEIANVPAPLDLSTTLNTLFSDCNTSLQKVRSSLDKIFSSDVIQHIKNDSNYHGIRCVGKTSSIDVKRVLIAVNDPIMTGTDEDEIQRELGDRYEATYSALKSFTLVQILPNRSAGVKWSLIDGKERNFLALMAEYYVITVLGKANSLPVFGFNKSWGATSLLSTTIRNTAIGKKCKSDNNNIFLGAGIEISPCIKKSSLPIEYEASYSDNDDEELGTEDIHKVSMEEVDEDEDDRIIQEATRRIVAKQKMKIAALQKRRQT